MGLRSGPQTLGIELSDSLVNTPHELTLLYQADPERGALELGMRRAAVCSKRGGWWLTATQDLPRPPRRLGTVTRPSVRAAGVEQVTCRKLPCEYQIEKEKCSDYKVGRRSERPPLSRAL